MVAWPVAPNAKTINFALKAVEHKENGIKIYTFNTDITGRRYLHIMLNSNTVVVNHAWVNNFLPVFKHNNTLIGIDYSNQIGESWELTSLSGIEVGEFPKGFSFRPRDITDNLLLKGGSMESYQAQLLTLKSGKGKYYFNERFFNFRKHLALRFIYDDRIANMAYFSFIEFRDDTDGRPDLESLDCHFVAVDINDHTARDWDTGRYRVLYMEGNAVYGAKILENEVWSASLGDMDAKNTWKIELQEGELINSFYPAENEHGLIVTNQRIIKWDLVEDILTMQLHLNSIYYDAKEQATSLM